MVFPVVTVARVTLVHKIAHLTDTNKVAMIWDMRVEGQEAKAVKGAKVLWVIPVAEPAVLLVLASLMANKATRVVVPGRVDFPEETA